ncbi:Organic cation/carnitine transporter [Arachis hypogaea]|nr:Organic cation/carnitine transporter [Arachis hypogaea]
MVVYALNAIFGCLTAFSPNYGIYVILCFLTGFSTGGVGLCTFVLATEPIGPTKHGIAGMSTFYFFSIGIAILSAVAYVFQIWRKLYIASSIPSILLILVIPFLSESPRWYLVHERVTEAMKIMSTIAFTNGKYLPGGVLLVLDEEVKVEEEAKTEALTLTYKNKSLENKDAVGGSIVDVLRSLVSRIRLILMVAINFFCAIVYYGQSLNVVNLDTNLYTNVVLNAVAKMPTYGIMAILLDKFRRKPLVIGTMWFSGLFCLLGKLMGNVGVWKLVRMLCGILGIFGMAGTYNLLFIYMAELFHTMVKNAALGCTTQAGQMGAILSPVVVVLG